MTEKCRELRTYTMGEPSLSCAGGGEISLRKLFSWQLKDELEQGRGRTGRIPETGKCVSGRHEDEHAGNENTCVVGIPRAAEYAAHPELRDFRGHPCPRQQRETRHGWLGHNDEGMMRSWCPRDAEFQLHHTGKSELKRRNSRTEI